MRVRLVVIILIMGALFFPLTAGAQTPISLARVQVQLWPEYDQPSMLVIYDFEPTAATELPVDITVRFPKDASLIAVAVQAADGSLLNAEYQESDGDDNWQTVMVRIQSPTTYRVEYYQPLSQSGNGREFSYLWPGDYDASDFAISVRLPGDATGIATIPELQPGSGPDNGAYFERDFGSLAAGQTISLDLSYTRASDELAVSSQDLQPSVPLNASTSGRVMLSNYLPYVLGMLGLLLVTGGAIYFWQSSRASNDRERRHRGAAHRGGARQADEYCHQCGTRAQSTDRFCRVCGSRLRSSG